MFYHLLGDESLTMTILSHCVSFITHRVWEWIIYCPQFSWSVIVSKIILLSSLSPEFALSSWYRWLEVSGKDEPYLIFQEPRWVGSTCSEWLLLPASFQHLAETSCILHIDPCILIAICFEPFSEATLGTCYGLNCTSFKFICWSPNPQYLRMWRIWKQGLFFDSTIFIIMCVAMYKIFFKRCWVFSIFFKFSF